MNPVSFTVYGIAGCGHSVGTTHFSVLLARFLSDVRHRRTAVLEWNGNGDFARIFAVHRKKTVTKPPPEVFYIKAEEYMPSAGRKQLLQCREREREAVVIDFGVYREGIEEEFARCDRRFILGGGNDWQIGSFAAFAAKRGKPPAEYLAAFGGETQLKLLERFLGIRIRHIPWAPEAGRITGEVLAFFCGFIP